MRKRGIFILFALIMIVQDACAWWAAAGRMAEPIILSFGTLFAAIGLKDQPNYNLQLFKSKEWFKTKFETYNEVIYEPKKRPLN